MCLAPRTSLICLLRKPLLRKGMRSWSSVCFLLCRTTGTQHLHHVHCGHTIFQQRAFFCNSNNKLSSCSVTTQSACRTWGVRGFRRSRVKHSMRSIWYGMQETSYFDALSGQKKHQRIRVVEPFIDSSLRSLHYPQIQGQSEVLACIPQVAHTTFQNVFSVICLFSSASC